MGHARVPQDPAKAILYAEVPVKDGGVWAHDRVVTEGIRGTTTRDTASPPEVCRDEGDTQMPA